MDPQIDSSTPTANTAVVCTLTSKAAAAQAFEWVDLRERASTVTPIENGVRMTLPASLVESVEDLARRERSCCAFLTIETSIVDEVLTLDLASPNSDALPVIDALAGVERT